MLVIVYSDRNLHTKSKQFQHIFAFCRYIYIDIYGPYLNRYVLTDQNICNILYLYFKTQIHTKKEKKRREIMILNACMDVLLMINDQ